MDRARLDELLLESEGTSLDFKREQYHFTKSTKLDKSELLKDVLAFANSFRRSDAYILIGVEEVGGSAARIVGISDHLDDAGIQQFVNSKTNQQIEFSYESMMTENGSVGIIRIPQQTRPFYLNNDYGSLKKGEVYYKLGSSTDIATPDVIAKMGRVDSGGDEQRIPQLHIELADIKDRTPLGHNLSADAVVHNAHDPDSLPDYKISNSPYSLSPHYANSNYWRELADYIRHHSMAIPIGFVVENRSCTLAQNVVAKIVLPHSVGVVVFDGLPDQPESSYSISHPFRNPERFIGIQNDTITVEEYGDTSYITYSFGNIQPNTLSWADRAIFLGPVNADRLELTATISADNLPQPVSTTFNLNFEVTHRDELSLESLKQIHAKYILNKFKDE